MSLRFRLQGPDTGSKEREIKIRLAINGEPIAAYNSFEKVHPSLWNPGLQTVLGQNAAAGSANQRLEQIRIRHKEIFDLQKTAYWKGEQENPPTAASIKKQWLDEVRGVAVGAHSLPRTSDYKVIVAWLHRL